MMIIDGNQIEEQLEEIADRINRWKHLSNIAEPIVFLCVLEGGLFFTVDLTRKLLFPLSVDTVCVKSYDNQIKGSLKLTKRWSSSLKGKHVIIIDEFADTGHTIQFIKELVAKEQPLSIQSVCMIKRHKCQVLIDYHGFTINADNWLIGYGLNDKDGLYRNSKSIWSV